MNGYAIHSIDALIQGNPYVGRGIVLGVTADGTKACAAYFRETGRQVTFEYSLIRDVNDSAQDAAGLAALARPLRAHINLIPVNPVRERGYRHPEDEAVRAFKNKLEKRGINVSIRRVMGRDIDGACGQLRHRHLTDSQ